MRMSRTLCASAVFLVVYILQALAWAGAEYQFEGIVRPSTVDSVVNGVLAGFVADKLMSLLDSKYAP